LILFVKSVKKNLVIEFSDENKLVVTPNFYINIELFIFFINYKITMLLLNLFRNLRTYTTRKTWS